jgi:DNA-binding NarL/FixJ family response regulator
VSRPLVVVEASERAFADRARALERQGLRVVHGWHQDAAVVCTGEVGDAADAAEALLAAVAGAGLVVHARAGRAVIDRLVDDLRRLGPVEHCITEPEPRPVLTPDERRLLDRLAEGQTLGRAAADLNLSRRTADRRLASARRKLGAAATAEAIVKHARSKGEGSD